MKIKELILFIKSAATGLVASLIDFLVLVLLVRFFAIAPTVAIIPAQVAGSLFQFLGNRYLVFIIAEKKRLPGQFVLFALTEVVSWTLNCGLYYLLVEVAKVNYVVARAIVAGAVYVGFSYPAWKWVFQDPGSLSLWYRRLQSAGNRK